VPVTIDFHPQEVGGQFAEPEEHVADIDVGARIGIDGVRVELRRHRQQLVVIQILEVVFALLGQGGPFGQIPQHDVVLMIAHEHLELAERFAAGIDVFVRAGHVRQERIGCFGDRFEKLAVHLLRGVRVGHIRVFFAEHASLDGLGEHPPVEVFGIADTVDADALPRAERQRQE
jgi:hypothetical protein